MFLLLALCSASAIHGMDSDYLIPAFDHASCEQAEKRTEQIACEKAKREEAERERRAALQIEYKNWDRKEEERARKKIIQRIITRTKKLACGAIIGGGLGAIVGHCTNDNPTAKKIRFCITAPGAIMGGGYVGLVTPGSAIYAAWCLLPEKQRNWLARTLDFGGARCLGYGDCTPMFLVSGAVVLSTIFGMRAGFVLARENCSDNSYESTVAGGISGALTGLIAAEIKLDYDAIMQAKEERKKHMIVPE